jgi:AcrR family transcriptional regulator
VIDKKVNIVYFLNMIHETDRRTRKRLEKTRLILSTAQNILLNEGLEAVTVHRIARELDLTVGALYRYFPSKQAMLTGLGEDIVRGFTTALTEMAELYASENQNDPLKEITEVFIIGYAFLDMAERSPARYRMVDLMLVDPRTMVRKEDRMSVLQTLFELLARVELLLEQACKKDLVSKGPFRERTIGLWSSLLGISSMQKMRRLYPEQVPADNLAIHTLHPLFLAWECKPSDLNKASKKALEFVQANTVTPITES